MNANSYAKFFTRVIYRSPLKPRPKERQQFYLEGNLEWLA